MNLMQGRLADGLRQGKPQNEIFDTNKPLTPRWKKFKPYFEAIKYGSYAWPVFAYIRDAQCIVISMRNVVALIESAPAYQYAILTISEGSEYEFQVDSTRAHNADEPDFRCILQPGNSGRIRCTVPSPMAYEPDYARLEFSTGTQCVSPPLSTIPVLLTRLPLHISNSCIQLL